MIMILVVVVAVTAIAIIIAILIWSMSDYVMSSTNNISLVAATVAVVRSCGGIVMQLLLLVEGV